MSLLRTRGQKYAVSCHVGATQKKDGGCPAARRDDPVSQQEVSTKGLEQLSVEVTIHATEILVFKLCCG